MFYQTTIKKITADGAKDIHGKKLKFVGNLPCEEGDTVWTDGKAIIGHIPIRGGETLPPPESGIPVAADEQTGYVKKTGSFKLKPIDADDWVTNNRRIFESGAGKYDGQKIIDAEISSDDGLYTVADGIYRNRLDATYTNSLFRLYHNYIRGQLTAYSAIVYITHYDGQSVTLGTGTNSSSPVIDNTPVKIFKDGTLVSSIPLDSFAQTAVSKCLTVRNEIMAKSEDISGAVNFFQQGNPPDSFVAFSFARVVSFKISPTGSWDAVILASAFGYCFPYLVLDGSVLETTFNDYYGASTSFSDDLVTCLNNIEDIIFNGNYYPFLNVTKYPDFTGATEVDGVYTDAYRQYIEDKAAYYIPRIRFKHYEWYVAGFGASMMFRVRDGVVLDTIVEHTYGGNDVFISNSWNEEQMTRTVGDSEQGSYTQANFRADFFHVADRLIERNWTFPIGDNFYLRGTGNQITGIVDESGATELSLPHFERGQLYVNHSPFDVATSTDTVAIELAAQMSQQSGYDELPFFWHKYIDLPAPWFTCGVNDVPYRPEMLSDGSIDYYSRRLLTDDIWDWKVQDGTGADNFYRDGYFRLNPSFAVLRGGKFLFCAYDEKLYLYDDGWRVWLGGLKNFRLCEMKNIKRAKKTGSA